MVEHVTELVGREDELDRLDAFVGDVAALPAALVIEGPAGTGKTTLWRAGVDAASVAGYLVLACRAAGAEVQFSYAVLSDLLEPHLDAALPSLPGPQRRALEVALLLKDDDGTAPDRRAIAAGALNALRALARARPVLLAIDDAQWVDAPSAEVIEFALRRLAGAPVATLASRRTGSPTAAAPAPTSGLRPERALERKSARLEVTPLSLGATHRLLRTRTSIDLNRRTLQRIHETSGGNPFYALELARAMESDRAGGVGGTEPLRLGGNLADLLADRFEGLGAERREVLFVASALTQPTVERISAATGRDPESVRAAIAADDLAPIARVVDGLVEFRHPLLAAAAYAALDVGERSHWHARIADVTTDAETRARHFALARPGPDLDVADLLHEAGRSALARGAPGIAAELFSEALERLPAPTDGGDATADELFRRRAAWVLEAAPVLRSAGTVERAKALVESALESLPPGPDRSEGLRLLAGLVESDAGGGQRGLALLDAAIVEAGSDSRRRAAALLDREMMERATARLDLALSIARQALEAAEASGDVGLEAKAHVATADLEVLLGLGGDDPIGRFARAEELDRRVHVDVGNSAPVMLAVCLIRAGRLDEARSRLVAGRQRAISEGDEASHALTCLCLAELEWLAGDWDAAAAYAAESAEVSEQAGMRMRVGSATALVALIEASRGNTELARATAERGIAICDEIGDVGYARYGRQILAFLDLSLGNAAAAARSLDNYALGFAIEGPKRIAFIGDAIEALVQLGEIDRAAGLAEELAARGAQVRRRPLGATAQRCLALVLAARGETEAALRSASGSVATFDERGHPFERARSLLVLGEVQRRAKHRREARETLTQAIDAFDALGAHLWSAKAKRERARIGGRSTIEGLSETELRVALLVAEGRSNKEVAAELFVSVRAVEANLSKVYAKLGIESRTELARRL